MDFQAQGEKTNGHDQPGHQNQDSAGQQNQGQGQQQSHQQQATAGIPGKDDERKLFVGGLSRSTTDKELHEHFSKFGEIESISVKVDPHTGVSRGFAFMVFANPKTIDKLLASGEHYINKRKVRDAVKIKDPMWIELVTFFLFSYMLKIFMIALYLFFYIVA